MLKKTIHTVGAVLLFSYSRQAVKLIVTLCSTLETVCVSAVLMESDILALLLGDVLLHFAQAVTRHFVNLEVTP